MILLETTGRGESEATGGDKAERRNEEGIAGATAGATIALAYMANWAGDSYPGPLCALTSLSFREDALSSTRFQPFAGFGGKR